MICKGCGDSFEKWNTRAKIPCCKTCDILFKKKWFTFPEMKLPFLFRFNRWTKQQNQIYSKSVFKGQENYHVCGNCDCPLKVGECYIKHDIRMVRTFSLNSSVYHSQCVNLIDNIKNMYPNLSQLLKCVPIMINRKRGTCPRCGKEGYCKECW